MGPARRVVRIGGDGVVVVRRRSPRNGGRHEGGRTCGKSVDYVVRLCEIYLEGRCSQTVFRQLFDEYLERAAQDGGLGPDHASRLTLLAERLGEVGLTDLRDRLHALLRPREVARG